MIEILPPHIANQIAAGEVVQRGGSIVKELLENAVDAGSTKVILQIHDGGRTLISVIDNGSGLSSDEAPKAFLRHATSKIKRAEDLFNLQTFGFRGEALASIAAVAEVEMKTRRECDELGTCIIIREMTKVLTEPCVTPVGTSITVRNLFYSIPARRKFLKSDRYEAQIAYWEFMRVAMVNPDVEFEYHSNIASAPLVVRISSLLERIVALTKPSYAKKLLPIEIDSPIVKLRGFIGTPDTARAKSGAEQYFFVNGRYMRSAHLSRAVAQAYDRLLHSGQVPTFFIFMTVPKSRIDVNINPTKTEIKFEDDLEIWQLINASVKSSLGKHNIVAAMDFEPSAIDIPSYSPSKSFSVTQPIAAGDRHYNPFELDATKWEVPEGFDAQKAPFTEDFTVPIVDSRVAQSVFDVPVPVQYVGFQFGAARYIVTQTTEGLAVINVQRARTRIEYERMLSVMQSGVVDSQLLTFAHTIELSQTQKQQFNQAREQMIELGFDVELDGDTVSVKALPVGLEVDDIFEIMNGDKVELAPKIAAAATHSILQQIPTMLNNVVEFIGQLMLCEEPSYTPSGLPIIEIVTVDELDKRLKK